MESCLQKADSSEDSYLLLQQTCLLLRSQLCCISRQVGLLRSHVCFRIGVRGQEETAAARSAVSVPLARDLGHGDTLDHEW